MLERLLRMYVMCMSDDIRSPLPHLVGPPGCGKSTVVEQLAALVGVDIHIINVSRINPLELEGLQMPVTPAETEDMILKMLPATFWTQLKDGDILLLDEFLRGFPEVYNGLLDILTSRKVAHFVLPKVFILGASNSVTTYDKALEDRLLHLPVDDPRSDAKAKGRIAKIIVEALGLLPDVTKGYEMQQLLDGQVLPMFNVLDSFKGRGAAAGAQVHGSSVRKLIGQALLREVQVPELDSLISENNRKAMAAGKAQYVFLLDGKRVPSGYVAAAKKLCEPAIKAKLTDRQARNLELNLQLVELEEARNEKEGSAADDVEFPDDIFM